MSEARANANQQVIGGNVNGGASAPVHVGAAEAPMEFPDVAPGQSMKVPESEAEADALLRAQFGNDPEKIRQASQQLFQKMQRMAEELEKAAAPVATAAPTPVQAQAPASEASPPPAEVPAPAPVVEAPVVPTPPVPVAHATAPAAPAPVQWHPPTYLPMPEGLFTWTPESWGGRPLHFVPDRVFKRDNQSPILIGILMAPAYARNRAGRVVSLPEGARVAIHAGVAWAPMLALAEGPQGRPVLIARPTPVDPRDPSGPSIVYERGDGAHEWGIQVAYEPDPKNPSYPRLIDIETVQGTRQDVDGGE